MNELILLKIGTSGLWVKEIKWSTFGVRRSRSRSHNATVRLGDVVEASLSTPSVQ